MVKDEMPNWPMDELNGGRAHTHTHRRGDREAIAHVRAPGKSVADTPSLDFTGDGRSQFRSFPRHRPARDPSSAKSSSGTSNMRRTPSSEQVVCSFLLEGHAFIPAAKADCRVQVPRPPCVSLDSSPLPGAKPPRIDSGMQRQALDSSFACMRRFAKFHRPGQPLFQSSQAPAGGSLCTRARCLVAGSHASEHCAAYRLWSACSRQLSGMSA